MTSITGVSLDIIIVNWNTGRQIRRCLDSIVAADVPAVERVVVVDNASTDGSADTLKPPPASLTVLRNSTNRGFAAACNQGAAGSRAEYLLFLNPDTTISRDALLEPITFLQDAANAGVAACGIQLVDERGDIARSCSRFPEPRHFYAHMLGLDRVWPRRFASNFMADWDHTDSREVDVVTGAFLMMRRAAFEALGGFDERFFVYLEDVDLLHAARRAGWRAYYLATARAFHKGGGSSEGAKAARLFYALRSRILYGNKNFGPVAATSHLLATLFVEPVSRTAWALARRSGRDVRDTWSAYGRLWRALPILVGRRARPTGTRGADSP